MQRGDASPTNLLCEHSRFCAGNRLEIVCGDCDTAADASGGIEYTKQRLPSEKSGD